MNKEDKKLIIDKIDSLFLESHHDLIKSIKQEMFNKSHIIFKNVILDVIELIKEIPKNNENNT